MIENLLIEKYLRQVVNSFSGVITKENEFIFRCNVCGDSKKNRHLKRGHLRYDNSLDKPFWYYKCFNGDCIAHEKAWSAEKWLKQFFPSMHKSYVKELIQNKNISDVDYIKSLNKQLKKKKITVASNKNKDEKKSLKNFVPILKGNTELHKQSIELCESRQIPKRIWKRFYVCEKGLYKDRLIIPFYNHLSEIYYFQARTLVGSDLKYLNRKSNKDNSLYNIYNVNRKKPIMATEGPIDSMFLDNSIALLGVRISDNVKDILNKLNMYYIFDDDKSGRDVCLEYLKERKNVFLWSKFKKDFRVPDQQKWDLNDVYIYLKREKRFTFKELESYFTNNMFDSIYI